MARRGARGKGWIRLMRIVVWVLAALVFLAGIILGIAVMGASDAAQTAAGQLMYDPNSMTFYFTVAGTGAGIAIMAVMAVFALVLLASASVYLDMAENVRRIAARVSRRAAEEEM
ncbi:MAG TPA: hypothetical protein IAA75_01400 [Candidatus Pullichristensenella avicola]|nr:hypothetical protein [Candidatus Pullichristensenella avicola]